MSTFEVKVQPIFIKPHPNADKLEIGNIGSPEGFQVIVQKGKFKNGELVAYIGENAVVPEWVLKKYGYWNEDKGIGMLAGSKGDRVKAIKLRDEFSLGIVIPLQFLIEEGEVRLEGHWVVEGDDVSDILGVTKYEPPIPIHMAGEVCNVIGHTLKYDIENWKKYPFTFVDDEIVFFTEKLHGTWCCIGYIPGLNHPDLPEGNIIVTSKGLSEQGLAFKDNEANTNNLYLRAFKDTAKHWTGQHIINRLRILVAKGDISGISPTDPVYILGEIFGPVQDLKYGLTEPQFRVFDVYVGTPSTGKYINTSDLGTFAALLEIDLVPILYVGPFSVEKMKEFTDGLDNINGVHMREGIVINPAKERTANHLGRVILKNVSQSYLLRKNKDATEFN